MNNLKLKNQNNSNIIEQASYFTISSYFHLLIIRPHIERRHHSIPLMHKHLRESTKTLSPFGICKVNY